MARGISSLGDVLTTTADGYDLNNLWTEFQKVNDMLNSRQASIAGLLSSKVAVRGQEVSQSAEGADFEVASEFGLPQSTNIQPDTVLMGYGFQWYDLAKRFTWQFLAEATREQVEAVQASVIAADERLQYRAIMRALLTRTTSTNRPTNEDGTPIFALWDGDTDAVPPPYAGRSFSPGHDHYLTTEAATPTGAHLRDLISHVTQHGYGTDSGDQMVVLVHPSEGEVIRGFRVATGSPFDFIPSQGAPAYLTSETLVGDRPPAEVGGLKIIGGFGDAWVVEDYMVPTGYMLATATGGTGSNRNALAFREHQRPELRGLRLVKGQTNNEYPLVDSVYGRGFGVGVRNRGAAAVMQVTASSDYATPASFA